MLQSVQTFSSVCSVNICSPSSWGQLLIWGICFLFLQISVCTQQALTQYQLVSSSPKNLVLVRRSLQRSYSGPARFSAMPSCPEPHTWSETGSTTWRHIGKIMFVYNDTAVPSVVYLFRNAGLCDSSLLSCRQCCVGTELVDWLVLQSACVLTRSHAVGMWQALLEERVLNHGKFSGVLYIER